MHGCGCIPQGRIVWRAGHAQRSDVLHALVLLGAVSDCVKQCDVKIVCNGLKLVELAWRGLATCLQ
eukprot:6692651-Alexandrium_andersonii.AAC.1